MNSNKKHPFTGALFHISNALNGETVQERRKHARLARYCDPEEKDLKAIEIIEREDFCFSHFLTEMGVDFARHFVNVAQKAITHKYKSGYNDYLKKR